MFARIGSALALLGALLAGVAWGLSSPVGSSPDEPYHLASIWCSTGEVADLCRSLPDTPEGLRQVEVPGLVAGAPCFHFNNTVSGECQKGLPDWMPTQSVDNGTYPGGFYRFMRFFVQPDVGDSVVLMRSVNVLLAVVLLGAVMILAPPNARRIQTYAFLGTMIPLGAFLIGSVNPSSWTIVGLAAFGFALHSHLLVPERRRMIALGVLGLVGLAMALESRGDAAAYAVMITGAVGIVHWRTFRARPRSLLVPVVAVIASLVKLFSASQVASVAGADAETDRTSAEVIVHLLLDFPTMFGGFFGYGFGLGWLDTPVHSLTAFGALVVFGFLVLSGMGLGGRPKALATTLLGAAVLVIPIMTLYRLRMIIGESVQPRYILPLVPVLLMLLLVGPTRDRGLRLTRGQGVMIWVLLVAANSAALYANTRRYVTGYDDGVIIDHHEWWWSTGPSPIENWVIGSVGFALLAAVIVAVSHRPRRKEA